MANPPKDGRPLRVLWSMSEGAGDCTTPAQLQISAPKIRGGNAAHRLCFANREKDVDDGDDGDGAR